MAARVLVTGGAGFIGSHVVERFVEEGYEVTVLDNLSSGRRENVPEAATLTEGDIGSEDSAALIREGEFDVICHLAAQIDVRKSVVDPMFDARVNVLGTLNLIEAMRSAERPCRFVFSSTGGAIYGDFEVPPSPEESAKEPNAPYGASKLSVEHYLAYYGRVQQLECVTLRYSNVYGPRQDPHGEAGVVAIFCGRLLQKRAMTIYGDGRQTRDYVFVEDVARANFAAATRPLPATGLIDARAFNVGTGRQTTVLQLAEQMCASTGITVPIELAPGRLGELQRSAVDVKKAERLLGWRPRVSLSDGLQQTFEWFASREAVIRT